MGRSHQGQAGTSNRYTLQQPFVAMHQQACHAILDMLASECAYMVPYA